MSYRSLYGAKPKSYFQGASEEMLRYLPSGAKLVLDVGCSGGGFGKLLKEKGVTVWGVEPNAEAAAEARGKLDVVINDEFSQDVLGVIGETRFDCVFFIDVLEHMVDPAAALELCRKLLRSGGCIVSAIPNVLQYGNIIWILRKQDWHYTESGIMDWTHLRFFTRKGIVRMHHDSGFEIVTIDGHNPARSLKFAALNMLTGRRFSDMKYMHFITVARGVRTLFAEDAP